MDEILLLYYDDKKGKDSSAGINLEIGRNLLYADAENRAEVIENAKMTVDRLISKLQKINYDELYDNNSFHKDRTIIPLDVKEIDDEAASRYSITSNEYCILTHYKPATASHVIPRMPYKEICVNGIQGWELYGHESIPSSSSSRARQNAFILIHPLAKGRQHLLGFCKDLHHVFPSSKILIFDIVDNSMQKRINTVKQIKHHYHNIEHVPHMTWVGMCLGCIILCRLAETETFDPTRNRILLYNLNAHITRDGLYHSKWWHNVAFRLLCLTCPPSLQMGTNCEPGIRQLQRNNVPLLKIINEYSTRKDSINHSHFDCVFFQPKGGLRLALTDKKLLITLASFHPDTF